jgi:hypothetical protein
LEILVRSKDAEQNDKLFEKITEVMKASGVSCPCAVMRWS